MSSLPHMPLFVDDFEAATTHLTMEEDGAYNRLLRLCWRTPGCSIPDDRTWIARRLRVDLDTYDRLVAPLLDEFFSRADGRVFQKRLTAEYEYVTKVKRERAEAGRKGGKSKSQKSKDNDPSKASGLPEHDGDDATASDVANAGKAVAPTPIPIPIPIREDLAAADPTSAREPDPAPPDAAAADPDFHDQVLKAARIDPNRDVTAKWHSSGQQWIVRKWLAELELTGDEVIAVVADVAAKPTYGSIGTLAFFNLAMREAAGRKNAPRLQAIASGQSPPDSRAAKNAEFDRYIARLDREAAEREGTNG